MKLCFEESYACDKEVDGLLVAIDTPCKCIHEAMKVYRWGDSYTLLGINSNSFVGNMLNACGLRELASLKPPGAVGWTNGRFAGGHDDEGPTYDMTGMMDIYLADHPDAWKKFVDGRILRAKGYAKLPGSKSKIDRKCDARRGDPVRQAAGAALTIPGLGWF